jgi:hypothetical protein
MAENEDKAPSLEEVIEAARTLNMVRRHVSGFGRLEVKQSIRQRKGRVLEAKLMIGSATYSRFVKPELAEVVQPAADVLTRALNANYSLNLDTSDRNSMVLSITI